MGLYEEAQKNVANCELNAALDKLNRALNDSQCEDNRSKIRQKIAVIKKAEPNLAKVKSLYADAKAEYGQCNYDNALSKMQTALNYAPCGRYRESLAQKIETTKAAKSYEVRTRALFSDANNAFKRCDYTSALQKLKLAFDHTRCARYKDSLRGKMDTVRAARQGNDRARSLLRQAQSLIDRGQGAAAVTKLQEASRQARCSGTLERIEGKLASLQSTGARTAKKRPAAAASQTTSRQSGSVRLGSQEYTLNGTYQWTCKPKLAHSTGHFELKVRVPNVEGTMLYDNFTRWASGTVKANGEISLTCVDTVVLTGRVRPSGSGNLLSGSGNIRNQGTAWGQSYTCSGTWKTD
jgi:hypothetical protein